MVEATDVRERLAREDPHFRALRERHESYEARLEVLRAQKYLSAEERLEETRLKKLKLAVKDEMEQLVRRKGG